ncbi:DUF3667 domain-containing protein [Flavobacterium sp. xlx-214]|uniref:DUF3667 domain-containing protein n=1 Tax=unclassified Flavobacterium TaxID=196869 RepID=UPI0013D64453|nr:MULTISPECIES: DUF3667 domain-containing protein [unclassified Flavobacterium]MBA5792635.1 DUF3667 domain-containing protein [Flavobacterium sp. xlx-221]QMI83784.1 DUF3667 domain-containing protein [Flavobacterium sp. xlx-214]
MNCKNCNNEVNSKYCPNCGQPTEVKRIDGHYIVHEITHLLHFEKGILYTIKQLLINPGKTIRKFILEDRSRLVKPVVFIIITSLVFSLVAHFFHIESFVSYEDVQNTSTANKIFKWGDINSGYTNIIIGVFIALWIKLFFQKSNFNLYEILILLCFVTGMSMLFFSVFAFLQGIIHFELMKISGIIGIIYCTWAIGQFFDKGKVLSYIKAFFAYVLGMMSFSLVVVIIGTLIDKLIGH